jgi:mannose-1-phosphate guanylyltransferase
MMKALLLAAGKGTRLRPYTDDHPKCLIPILGAPLLKIWLDNFEKHGIDEVLINTHHHADQVERFIDGQRLATRMKLHTVYEPDLLGSAGTLWQNRDFIAGDSDFVIAYADNLTTLNLGKMIDFHKKIRSMGGILTMGLIEAPDPTACGIVTLDNHGRVVRFVEKPSQPESDLANAGVYVAAADLFEEFKQLPAGTSRALDLGYDLLPQLVGKMYGFRITDYLADIGTPQSYSSALTRWKKLKKPEETT